MPRPPTAISGSVSASSPDSTRKSDGTARQISHICVMLPDASLTPTMFGIAREPRERRRLDVDAGAAGHVVDDDRQRRALGDRAVVLVRALPASACCSTASPTGSPCAPRASHLARRAWIDLLRVVAAGAGQHRHLALRLRRRRSRRCAAARRRSASGSRRSCRTARGSGCRRRSAGAPSRRTALRRARRSS